MSADENLPDTQLAQHNALINARFSMLPLQMRLFVAMLAQQDFDQTDFREHFIPIGDLLLDNRGGSGYAKVHEMCEAIVDFKIYIEELESATRRRSKQPVFTFINLISKAKYDPQSGGVLASFNADALPYLLQLRECGNFTLADLSEVQKLRSPTALRIYWLLKEYAKFGKRTMTVPQLRFVLDIADHEYPQFRSLKAKVLEVAREQLSVTDVPFTYEVERQGKIAQRVTFMFEAASTKKADPLPVDEWATTLRNLGVAPRSLATIQQQLEAGEYTVDYIRFVVQRVKSQVALKKIIKPAGAIYKALVEKYLLADYLESLSKPPAAKKGIGTKKSAPAEVAYPVAEVQSMYDNPGPYAKQDRLPTFEAHLQAIYLSQGFTLEERAGQQWLVKKEG
ncbi:replication initiation protein [Hymenobacter sp. YC55]|uniref:replication initiation protein n=1 Tax=Hymenobacter sp. YC55 TaxID=3034019 RepID=UPI0023F8F6B0|nr:replication initiation protein [Hymenobacter sp. YC55]MDF7815355.1 replication initiation protein [Hymenobacter sp. YC55]